MRNWSLFEKFSEWEKSTNGLTTCGGVGLHCASELFDNLARGDLERLAPRKKLLKGWIRLIDSLRAFRVSLARRAFLFVAILIVHAKPGELRVPATEGLIMNSVLHPTSEDDCTFAQSRPFALELGGQLQPVTLRYAL